MSFAFNWKAFAHEQEFQAQIRDMLTNALNKNKPRILEGKIRVLNLDWGDNAPSLEILEIGDVAADRFRGIFKFQYTGAASITIAAQVQANLLNVYAATAPNKFVSPAYVGAPVSFTIPLHLTLSDIRLQGIVIIVFSKAKGLTLVFRNDPLQHIKVSSTFDTLPGIPAILQSQIEHQIRGLFREELPGVLYKLSLRYTPSGPEGTPPPLPESRKNPATFAEIDQEKQVSVVNIQRLDALSSSTSTLSLSTPTIPWALIRPELHRLELQSRGGQINLIDKVLLEQVHSQAAHIASRSNHPRKRRVIRLHHRSNGADTSQDLTSSTLTDQTLGQTEHSDSTYLDANVPGDHPERMARAHSSPALLPTLVRDTKSLLTEPLLVRPHAHHGVITGIKSHILGSQHKLYHTASPLSPISPIGMPHIGSNGKLASIYSSGSGDGHHGSSLHGVTGHAFHGVNVNGVTGINSIKDFNGLSGVHNLHGIPGVQPFAVHMGSYDPGESPPAYFA